MRITSMKTIYLTEDELKTAVFEFMKHTVLRNKLDIQKHIEANWDTMTMEWTRNEEFAITTDGQMED